MNSVKTKSFELAIYARGNESCSKLALVLPGRLDTKDYVHMRSHVDYLGSRNYYALSFDPPGSWDSPGSIDLYTVTNYIKAINELIEYFGNKPTLLMGHSNGGKMAMLVGPKNPYVTHIVSAMSQSEPSTTDIPSEKGQITLHYRDLPPGIIRTKEQKTFMLPYSYFEDQLQYDATEGLKICTKPKLFFYGTKDVLVDKETIKKLYEVSADSKMIHELNSEHDYRLYPEIINEVNKVTGIFLDTYL